MKRLAIIALVYCVGLVLGLEVLLAGYYYLRTDELYYGRTQARSGDKAPAYHVADAVFQPYFGYTLRPGREAEFFEARRWRANNFGFVQLVDGGRESCCDYPYPRRDGERIVGIFGGSVGSGYALFAELTGGLANALRRVPGWEDQEIRILNFAQPGFKQPQQLFTYLYFHSIGQTFDLVINIDGFNEVVTTWRNWGSGVEPNYPADTLWGAWGRHLEQYDVPFSERGYLLSNYHLISGRGIRESAGNCALAICYFASLALANYHDWRAAANQAEALDHLTERSYFPTQTFSPLPKDLDIHRYTANLWRISSVALARQARANGVRYLHLLQPNQWFEPAGPYEPIDPAHPHGWVIEPVNQGYSALLSEAGRLHEAGVAFVDLTLVFEDRPAREVYVDDCCHYTSVGYQLIFDATVEALKDIVGHAESLGPTWRAPVRRQINGASQPKHH